MAHGCGWRLVVVRLCLLACVGTMPTARAWQDAAPTAPQYAKGPPSADGIGKTYMGREIASIMGWQGADWLERREREREERGSRLLRALGLEPGQVVADIGAGSGYFTRRIAPKVAPGGRVIAVDVQPEMVAMLAALASEPGLANVEPRLGTPSDPGLAPASVDIALMVDVYHELEYPAEMLRALVAALKPDGRVVFVEYRGEDPSLPIKPLHTMTEAQIRREAEANGLAWVRTSSVLPQQHIVEFRRAVF